MGNFVDEVNDFIVEYNYINMYSPSVYKPAIRRPSDLMYCSVEFNEGYNNYYYISDDDSIEVGDRVVARLGETTARLL
ncbi:MAG: hypothetical protein ACI4WS_07665 [Oscillospiraceae bacterium]